MEFNNKIFADGKTLMFDFNGETIAIDQPIITELQISYNTPEEIHYMGSNDVIRLERSNMINIELSIKALGITQMNSKIAIRDFIKANTTIDDLFKIVNSKLKDEEHKRNRTKKHQNLISWWSSWNNRWKCFILFYR